MTTRPLIDRRDIAVVTTVMTKDAYRPLQFSQNSRIDSRTTSGTASLKASQLVARQGLTLISINHICNRLHLMT